MPDEARLELVREDSIAILFLDNPPRNLVTRPMFRDLAEKVESFGKDDSVRTVIVAGAGEVNFSGGLDMHEWSRLSAKQAQEELARDQDTLWALEHLSKPTIAAISGMCRGAGAEIALACDVRIASENAVFSHPEIDAGWMPSHGGTARMARLVGRSKASELLLSGKALKAIDALRLGLVDHLTPSGDALDRAKELARVFASKPPLAVRAIKRTLLEGELKPYRNRFLLESQHAIQLLHSEEYQAAQERVREKK